MTSNVGSQALTRGGGKLGFQTAPDTDGEQSYQTMKAAPAGMPVGFNVQCVEDGLHWQAHPISQLFYRPFVLHPALKVFFPESPECFISAPQFLCYLIVYGVVNIATDSRCFCPVLRVT